MNDSFHYVSWLLLKDFGTRALVYSGIPGEDARIMADTLVEAELRGVDTHGLVQLAPFVRMVTEGKVNPRPRLSIVKETPTSAVLDGDNGIGNLVCFRAAEIAIAKAQTTGIGIVGTRNSTHCGALAYYPMLALKHDLMGFMTVNGPPLIPAYGGLTRLFSTNPYSAAIPAGEERPVVLDMAVTVATRGKMRLKARLGERIPPGWALDRYGQPTQDPREALDYGFQAWMGEHKGYGLAVLANILSGVLTGSAFSPQTYPPYDMAAEFGSQRIPQGQFIMVLSIDSFMPPAEFKGRMDALIREIKGSQLARGSKRVYLPGELEFEKREQRLKTGIPLSPPVWESLLRLGSRLGIPLALSNAQKFGK